MRTLYFSWALIWLLLSSMVAFPGCGDGTVSSGNDDGAVGPPCTDECTAGASSCNGAVLVHCGNYDGDSCNEWGDPQACSGTCNVDHCEATCSSTCTASEIGCTDVVTRWYCTDTDQDGCLEPREEACGELEHCDEGACVTSWVTTDLGVAASYFDVTTDASGQMHLVWSQGADLRYARTDGATLTDTSTLTTTAHSGIMMPPWISVAGGTTAVVYGTGQPPSCGLCLENVMVALREGQGPWTSESVFSTPDCDLYTYPNLALAGDGGLHVLAACVLGASTTYMDYRYRPPAGTWDADVKQGPYNVDFESRLMTDGSGRVHMIRSIWCNPSFYQVAEVGARFGEALAEDQADLCLGGMVAQGDAVHAFWIEFPTGSGSPCSTDTARLMHATNDGLGFETQPDVAEIAYCGDYNLPAVTTLERGDLVVAWAESSADDEVAERIRVAGRKAGADPWRTSEIATTGGVQRSATVKIAAVGNRPFVFWLNGSGTISVSTYQ